MCLLSFFIFRYLLPRWNNIFSESILGSPAKMIAVVKMSKTEKTIKTNTKTEKTIKTNTVLGNINFLNIKLPSLPIVIQEYFKILFFHPIFLFIFLFGLFILFKEKELKMLSFYFSCLSFTLVSSIHPYGYRSLLFLWPVTFLLFAFFVFYTFRLFSRSSIYLGKLLLAIFIACFIILTSFYNIHWAKVMNKRKNIAWDRSCAAFLLDKADSKDVVLYQGKLARAAFFSAGMIARKSVCMETFNYYHQDFNKFPVKFLVLKENKKPQELETIKRSLLKKCGYFNIYQVKE